MMTSKIQAHLIILMPLLGLAQPVSAAQVRDPTTEKPSGFISSINQCSAQGAQVNAAYVDKYTRLEFATQTPVALGRNYGKELRNPINRFFAGKALSRTLSLVTTYSRHKVEATTTVASFNHRSGRKGYEWASEVSNQRLITPYFRIDHDGIVKTNWKLALNKTYDASTLQDLLDVVKRATTLITPTSGLLTSLNANRFKDTSQFIDQSISSFLKESVDEIAPDEFPLAACAGQPLVTLALELPEGGNLVRNNVGVQSKPVGIWTVRLSKPIDSIFLPMENRQTPLSVMDAIGAGSIFDYQVGVNVSLGQFLGGDSAVSAVRDEFKANNSNLAVTATKLCSLIVGKVQGIGLNRFDAAVTVHAFADQFLSVQAHRDALLSEANCAVLKNA